MQQEFPSEFQWLADLANEVNQLSGFYKNEETAAIYCPHCQIIQAYCTGCGEKLIDVYDEESQCCENCGISLSHCRICGYELEEQTTAPEDVEKPEYWKYCPACGGEVFAVTDMCPHCHVSMGQHLDRVYEETVDRVSHATHIEEMLQSSEQKPKHKSKPVKPTSLRWAYFFYGSPIRFETDLSLEDSIAKLERNLKSEPPGASTSGISSSYWGYAQVRGRQGYAQITRTEQNFTRTYSSTIQVVIETIGDVTYVTVEVMPEMKDYLSLIMAISLSIIFLLMLPTTEGFVILLTGWLLALVYLRIAFRMGDLLRRVQIWLGNSQPK